MKVSKKNLISGSLFLLLVFLCLYFYNKIIDLQAENAILNINYENLDSSFSESKNKTQSLLDLNKSLYKENDDLYKEILILKKKKKKIEYVTTVKYETEIVEKIVKVLPDEFLFKTSFGMPICHYQKIDSDYSFKTLPVSYRVSVITSEDSTNVAVKAFSDYDQKTYTLPLDTIDTETVKIQKPKDKIISPHFSIGASLDTSYTFDPNIGISFIHYKNFDFLKTNFILSDKMKIGISPVSYNIKDKVILFQDLSLEIGYSSDFNNNFLYLGISTKL